MSNVTKRTYTVKSYKNKYPTQLGWNYGNQAQDWYDDVPKKNNEETTKTSVDIADDLIQLINTDYEYEDILLHYYDHIGDSASNYKMYTGKLKDTEIARNLIEVYNNQNFISSEKGREVVKLTKEFLREQSADNGVDTTLEDLKYGIEQLQYDEYGERFQFMDTEDGL